MNQLTREMRIPPRYVKPSFEHFKGIDKEIKKGKNALATGQSIIFLGAPGTGKTELGCCFMQWWYWNLKTVKGDMPIFISAPDLFQELRASFSGNTGYGESEILNPLYRAGLVMLDDLGKGKNTEYTGDVFYRLIERRHRDMKPMIITSNFSAKQIAEEIDPAIASRLFAMGVVINLGDEDHRLKRGDAK